MNISTVELWGLMVTSAVTGSGITVVAYLFVIGAFARPGRRAASARHRPAFGADITYADELTAYRTSDVTPADPQPEGEGDDEQRPETDISPFTDEGSECDRADQCTFDPQCPFAARCREIVEQEGAIMDALADDIRAAAGYPAGRPVPPPATPQFNYARPYVMAPAGGAR